MNATVERSGMDTLPWYRQFWPWFIIALPGSAVIGGFVTLWIAIGAAPDRIDGYGLMAIEVNFTPDRQTILFDLGPPRSGVPWPAALTVTVVSQGDGATQILRASQFDGHRYRSPVTALTPGSHRVSIEDADAAIKLRGSWDYPAPVWKMRVYD